MKEENKAYIFILIGIVVGILVCLALNDLTEHFKIKKGWYRRGKCIYTIELYDELLPPTKEEK